MMLPTAITNLLKIIKKKRTKQIVKETKRPIMEKMEEKQMEVKMEKIIMEEKQEIIKIKNPKPTRNKTKTPKTKKIN